MKMFIYLFIYLFIIIIIIIIFFFFFFVFVGNIPLGLPFKETFNDILLSSVVLPIHPAKVCMYGNLHYVVPILFC